MKNKDPKVAVVYHYWAHYREPIARKLCEQEAIGPEYVLFSDSHSNNDIKTIDFSKSSLPISGGGLRWRIIKNFWITKDVLWQSGLIRLALSREFDAIIYLGQMYFLSTWVSAILARLTGKRVLMWTHGFLREENNLKGLFRSCFYKLANGVLLYGHRARQIMLKKGFDPNNLYVVYNSLDYDYQKKLRACVTNHDCNCIRQKLFNAPDLPILIFIGRLTPQKKLDMLLKATKILNAREVRVNVLFVGDGAEREMLEELSVKLGLCQNVKFYGACHEEVQLSKLIMLSDICVAPGEVGLTAMHSLAYGTPVITHDDFSQQMPEYEAIREGVTGMFFRRGDTEDLALKIESWLLNKSPKPEVMQQCISIIEKYYNPKYQVDVINTAVLGKSAEVS